MQYFVAAVLALAATTVSAWGNGTVYTTEVHTAYTTVCPAATTLSFNGITYTVSQSTTLTITNCPCTIVKPVTTSSVVYCNTCSAIPTTAPVYANTTTTTPAVVAPTTSQAGSVGTTSAKASPSATPSTISASSGNKAIALSGASLAGLLGVAAYFL